MVSKTCHIWAYSESTNFSSVLYLLIIPQIQLFQVPQSGTLCLSIFGPMFLLLISLFTLYYKPNNTTCSSSTATQLIHHSTWNAFSHSSFLISIPFMKNSPLNTIFPIPQWESEFHFHLFSLLDFNEYSTWPLPLPITEATSCYLQSNSIYISKTYLKLVEGLGAKVILIVIQNYFVTQYWK